VVIVKDEAMMQKEEVVMKDEAIVKDEIMMKNNKMIDDKTVIIKGGMYEAYSLEKLSNAETGNVVLFFKADWCPSCKTVDADIISNTTQIPKDLTILDVDYDTNPNLKKKYGVTYQHTFVQVDHEGNMIKKWSGGSTLNSIVKEII
jgi:thiol-disulfide isomerase/thioredoxin